MSDERFPRAGRYDRDDDGRQHDGGGEYGARNEPRAQQSRPDTRRDPYADEGFGGASYGEMNQGQSRYGAGGFAGSGRNRDSGDANANRNWGEERYGARAYGGNDRDSYLGQTQGGPAYAGGERFDNRSVTPGRNEIAPSGYGRDDRDHAGRDPGRDDGRYDYQDRGFIARAGDEVRSWFGDDDAQRRRELDQRNDGGSGSGERVVGSFEGERVHFHHDRDYHQWRQGQIEALDRDYHEYRQENHQKFANEFGAFRTERQGQRSLLDRVDEHMEVLGIDGEHVGTVDKVRGDRIVLTKKDKDAGGHHHSIPSRWLERVEDKVTIRKTGAEAKAQWRDEERAGASGDQQRGSQGLGMYARPTPAADTAASPMLASGTAVDGGTEHRDGTDIIPG